MRGAAACMSVTQLSRSTRGFVPIRSMTQCTPGEESTSKATATVPVQHMTHCCCCLPPGPATPSLPQAPHLVHSAGLVPLAALLRGVAEQQLLPRQLRALQGCHGADGAPQVIVGDHDKPPVLAGAV